MKLRDVPLQEVSRHPLPRPLRHGLLRKRRAVPGPASPGAMDLDQYKNRDWIEVTGPHGAWTTHAAYQGKGPVMNILSVQPCEKPKNDVVSF